MEGCHNVCLSLCLSGTSLSESSSFSSLSILSQVSVSSLTYFVVKTEPKILRLVSIKTHTVTLQRLFLSILCSVPRPGRGL